MFIVTGGGSGIGRALAHALATLNQQVLIIGRRADHLKETAMFSKRITYLCADVSTDTGRKHIKMGLDSVSTITALIHNAGTVEPILPLSTLDESSFRQAMATNCEGPLFLTQLLQDKLINGRVLHMGSGAAHFPVAGWAAYCVSKSALSMLTQCWQLESSQIAFASVMPGIIDTDMQAIIRASACMDADKVEFFRRLKSNQQLIAPATVALFLCWLLLDIDKAHYVSKEWDIYDESHHPMWLVSPHSVPRLES